MSAYAPDYIKDPQAIYDASFARVRSAVHLDNFPDDLVPIALRLIHSCGMPDIADDLSYSDDVARSAINALGKGGRIICDCEMVASGITRRFLPNDTKILVTLNDPKTPQLASQIGTTRSAAAVELWDDHLEGAVVAIGNAPTALFHLLEKIAGGGARPAAILGFAVGFVGAAESKAALADFAADTGQHIPFITLQGRRGGSAMAAAAVNAIAIEASKVL